MRVGIIPEAKPFLPRGALVRTFSLLALVGGAATTFHFQEAFIRPGVSLEAAQLPVLGLSYLPYLVAVPLVWHSGESSLVQFRLLVLTAALLLPGSSVLGLYDAFVVSRDAGSGRVFVLLPIFQLAGVLSLWLLGRAFRTVDAARSAGEE